MPDSPPRGFRRLPLAVLVGAAVLSLSFLVGSFPSAPRPAGERYSRVRGDGLPPRAPNSWFYIERAYPLGRIPLERWRAARDRAAGFRAKDSRRGPTSLGSERGSGGGATTPEPGRGGSRGGSRTTWTPRGPTNIGGRITDIAVDPNNGNIVFAAAAEGGVLRSLDGGQTWTPLFDDQPALSVGALAIDPGNPMRIYAGTGEVNPGGGSVAYGGAGLFRSDDRGDTWTFVGLDKSGSIGRIRIDPGNPDRIFAAAMGCLWEDNPERGVYRSTDGGATWQRVLFIDESTGCVDLVMRPDDPDVIFAAMWERVRRPEYYRYGGPNCAVYRSTDGGGHWSIVGGGLPAPSAKGGRIGLSLCASQPDVMHAVYADETGYFAGLYRSTDGGNSWTRTNDGALAYVFSSYGWWFGNVRTHPLDPDTIFVLGLDLYRSTNGGASYQYASSGMHVDHHGLAFGPGPNPVIYNGNDGGVYRSANGGTAWTKLPDLPITQVYRAALDGNNPNALYCGAQDNGTCRTSSGGTGDWSMIYGGDGFQPLVHPNASNRIWAQYQYGSLAYSSNGGSTWYGATGGISGSDRRNWNSPLVQDPTDPDRRYFGTNKVYRSTSDTSWTPISPDLTGGPHQGHSGQVNGTITTISVSPLDGNVIWAGSDDGHVNVTVNGGSTWTDVSSALPDRWITSVRADPNDRETAYATISGFRWAEPLPRVFKTEDLGATWVSIAGNLPDAPVNDLMADPERPGRFFAACDVGVFETIDGGGTWEAFGEGLPNVVVTSLALDEANRTLVAGTYGRSFFSSPIGFGAITSYGEGLAGSGGFVPRLLGSGDLAPGGMVTLDLSDGLGGAQGLLVVGPSRASYPLFGGTLLVYPFFAKIPVTLGGTPGAPGNGSLTHTGPMSFPGMSLDFQALLSDPGAVQGVSMSKGLELLFP